MTTKLQLATQISLLAQLMEMNDRLAKKEIHKNDFYIIEAADRINFTLELMDKCIYVKGEEA